MFSIWSYDTKFTEYNKHFVVENTIVHIELYFPEGLKNKRSHFVR